MSSCCVFVLLALLMKRGGNPETGLEDALYSKKTLYMYTYIHVWVLFLRTDLMGRVGLHC